MLGTAHILGFWFSIAYVILLVVVCLGTGLWVRRLGVTTVPQLLSQTYGIENRLFVSCVMAWVMFGILTIEAQGIGIIFASLADWDIATGVLLGGSIGIAAGMKETGWVNLVNAVVMYIGLVLATVFIATKLPGSGLTR